MFDILISETKRYRRCPTSSARVLLYLSLVFVMVTVPASSGRCDVLAQGRVAYIIDGDSLCVEVDGSDIEVRLWGIDSPEYDQPKAEQSKGALSKLASGRNVDLKIMYQDRYGRTVAEMFVAGGSVNEQMVSSGQSWVHPYFCREPVCRRWKLLETAARRQRLGIWNSDNPVPPWEWKKQR